MRDAKGRPLYKNSSGRPTTRARGSIQAQRGEDLLYLSPANALSRNGRDVIRDRTNNGRGFTLAELDELQVEERRYVYTRHWSKRDSYLADRSNWLIKDSTLAEMLEPTRHKQSHINDCLRQLDDVKAQVLQYQSQLNQHIQGMEAEISSHLWVSAEFATPEAEKLKQTQNEVHTLLARVSRVREGFELLPLESEFADLDVDEAETEEQEEEQSAEEDDVI